jgi:hypothetical protein
MLVDTGRSRMGWEVGAALRCCCRRGAAAYGGYEAWCCAWWARGIDWRWERRGEWDDDDEVSARGDGNAAGEPEGELAYALGLTPSEPAAGCSRSSI